MYGKSQSDETGVGISKPILSLKTGNFKNSAYRILYLWFLWKKHLEII